MPKVQAAKVPQIMKGPLMRPFLVASLACLALIACKEEGSPVSPASLMGEKVEWRVTEIGGKPVPTEVTVTLGLMQDGLIAGTSGCNRYNGRIAITEGKLHLGELAGTRMMCPAPQMAVEANFHAAMAEARDMRREGEALVMRNGAGEVLIRASR